MIASLVFCNPILYWIYRRTISSKNRKFAKPHVDSAGVIKPVGLCDHTVENTRKKVLFRSRLVLCGAYRGVYRKIILFEGVTENFF